MHNEVLEDGRQNKLDLTRLIKTFTLDLVTEYNLEVRVSHCINKSHRRKTGKTGTHAERDLGSYSAPLVFENFVCLFDQASPKHI